MNNIDVCIKQTRVLCVKIWVPYRKHSASYRSWDQKCYNHPRSHLLEIVALHAATRVVRHYVVAYNQIKKINHKASGSSFICPPWCGYRVKSFTVWPFNLVVFFEVLPHQGSFFFFFFPFLWWFKPCAVPWLLFLFHCRTTIHFHPLHALKPRDFQPTSFYFQTLLFPSFLLNKQWKKSSHKYNPLQSVCFSFFANCLPHSGRTVAVYSDYFMFSLCGCLLE